MIFRLSFPNTEHNNTIKKKKKLGRASTRLKLKFSQNIHFDIFNEYFQFSNDWFNPSVQNNVSKFGV